MDNITRYLQNIEDVIKINPKYQCSDEKFKEWLTRMFEAGTDQFGKIISEYYISHQKQLWHRYRDIAGHVAAKCKAQCCEKCSLSKWCNEYRSLEQEKSFKEQKPVFADFFCGAGGLSLGFKQAGYKLSLANDIQKCCIETYQFNHPETPSESIVCGDINNVLDSISEYRRFSEIDVVAGGPPCQGFSMANRQRLIDDPRNHLYKSFIQAVDILHPHFVVMENVRGILAYKDQIFEDYGRIGYKVSAHLLNAIDFGVPQNRLRTIFIANRDGINNEEIFDAISAKCSMTERPVLEDAIGDLPVLRARTEKNNYEDNPESGYTITDAGDLSGLSSDYVSEINRGENCPLLMNHKARYNNKRDIEIFSRLNPGDNSTDEKITDIMPYARRNHIFKDKYYKLRMDVPCKTITAHMRFDCNMYIHPTQARGLTPREAARVQSYPDSYFFTGAYTTTYMQIGNAVPPVMGRIIAESIRNYLK